jgi:hypothetical protein
MSAPPRVITPRLERLLERFAGILDVLASGEPLTPLSLPGPDYAKQLRAELLEAFDEARKDATG